MSNARWFLAAALGAAALLGAWAFLLLGGVERRAAPLGPPSAAVPTSGEAARPAELAAARAAASEPVLPEGAREPSAGVREALAATAAQARELEVVEAGSLRAVPGAEVWFRACAEGDFDPEAFARLVGHAGTEHTTADARGRTRIPWPADGDVLVLAASGERRGGRVLRAAQAGEPARLELHLDWDVVVEVSDARGTPAAGVPVVLEPDEGSSSGPRTTDAEGRVSFGHVGLACALSSAIQVRVRVDLALAEGLEQVVQRARPPREPIRFQLPPLGGVAVLVQEPDGRPVEDGTGAELGLVWPGESRDISPFAHRERERIPRKTAGGRAFFEFVELGAEVELVVRRAGLAVVQKDYFPGPRFLGERIERTVVLGVDHPILSFRAVDVAGKAIADTRLELDLRLRAGFMLDEQEPLATTDGEGRFQLDLPGVFRPQDRRWLRVTLSGGAIGAEVDLSRSFEPGIVPMGDLVLGPAPLLAAGRVVDAAGQAVAGAELVFQLPVMEDEGEDADPGQVWYWNHAGIEARSDALGAFAVQAFVGAEQLRVMARGEAQLSDVQEVPVGSRGLELVLRGTGRILGSLLLDPGLPTEELRLSVRRADSSEEEGWAQSTLSDAEGGAAFVVDQLRPGTHSVKVGCEGDERLVVIDGVEVRSGQDTRDPRLDGIDLRGKLHVLRLLLVGEGLTDDLNGNLTYGPAAGTVDDDGEREHWHWVHSAPVVVVSPYERIDGTLALSGFRPVQLQGVGGDHEVHLEPAIRVRLVLPSSVRLPDPPVYVKATLAPESSPEVLDWGGNVFDESREILCLAPGAGRMQVRWILERRSGGGASATTMDIEPVQLVEVLDVPGAQRLELVMTDEALARALAEMDF